MNQTDPKQTLLKIGGVILLLLVISLLAGCGPMPNQLDEEKSSTQDLSEIRAEVLTRKKQLETLQECEEDHSPKYSIYIKSENYPTIFKVAVDSLFYARVIEGTTVQFQIVKKN